MANELQTSLDAILNDKNVNLKPENLKQGVTCLGVEGTYQGILSRVQSNLVIADYEKSNSITGLTYSDAWKATGFTTWFVLPYDIGTSKYVCGISNMGDGTYKRWLVVYDTSYSSMIDFTRYTDTYAGMHLSPKYVSKCFKFSDITDISVLVDGYGKDELGEECELSDLPYISGEDTPSDYNDDNMIILCPKTSGAGYIGQNYTSMYHTPYKDIEIWTDQLNTDFTMSGRTVYNNLGQKYEGSLDASNVVNVLSSKGLTYQYQEDYKTTEPSTRFCTLLPENITLKKYYCFWEYMMDMGGRYNKECYLVTDDEPLNISFALSSGITWLKIIKGNNTKMYRYDYNSVVPSDKFELVANRKNVMIYDGEDIDFSLLGYITFEEQTDLSNISMELRTTPKRTRP